jgi:hypothetical protein
MYIMLDWRIGMGIRTHKVNLIRFESWRGNKLFRFMIHQPNQDWLLARIWECFFKKRNEIWKRIKVLQVSNQ